MAVQAGQLEKLSGLETWTSASGRAAMATVALDQTSVIDYLARVQSAVQRFKQNSSALFKQQIPNFMSKAFAAFFKLGNRALMLHGKIAYIGTVFQIINGT